MALCIDPILNGSLLDQPFLLYTNALDVELGAMLTQNMPQGEQPIYFLSSKLSTPECNYAVIEKVALAIRWAMEEFKYYLWERQFTVITDQAPLQWLHLMKGSNPQLMQC